MEWMAFYQMEPWGWEADCYHAGLIAAQIANSVRDPKRFPKPFQARDFMPEEFRETTNVGIDPKRVRAKLIQAFGGRIKHGRQDRLRTQRRRGDGSGLKRIGAKDR